MILLEINGNQIFLKSDTNIVLNSQNPAFVNEDLDKIVGVYSFPFDIPIAGNEKALGFPHRLDNANDLLEDAPARLNLHNYIIDGKITVLDSFGTDTWEQNPKSVKVTFVSNALSKIGSKKLNQLDLEDPRFMGFGNAGAVQVATDSAIDPSDKDFIFFPVYSNSWFKKDNQTVTWEHGYINDWLTGLDRFYAVGSNPSGFPYPTFPQEVAAFTPFVKLSYVLERIVKTLTELDFINEFQVTEELKKLVLYNNYNFIESYNPPKYPSFIDLRKCLSETNTNDFFKKICKFFCLAPFIDYNERTLKLKPLRDVLNSNSKHDWSKNILKNYSIRNARKPINVIAHGEDKNPDVNFQKSELLYEDTIVFDTYNQMVAAQDGIPGVYYVIHLQKYFWGKQIIDPDNGIDEFVFTLLSDYNASYQTSCKKEGETLEIDLTYPKEVISPKFHPEQSIPSVNCRGTFRFANPPIIQKFADKLMFYRGMRYIQAASRYPYANYSIYYEDGTTIPNMEYSLFFHGESGIFNRWWKDWASFMCNAEELTVDLDLSISALQRFNYDDIVQINNQKYLVKEMQITYNDDGVKPVKAKLLRIKA